MAQKLTQYLLIALVLSLGLGQLLRFEIGGIPIYFHDVIVAIILLAHAGMLFATGADDLKRVPLSIRLILLSLVIGWGRAATLYPITSLAVPFLYTVRTLAYLALYCLLNKVRYRISKKFFYLAGIVTLCIGIGQYLVMPDMRWAQYLGWDDHLNRIVMPHYDPTFTGIMLVLALLLSAGHGTKKSIAMSLLYGIAILLTYSRSVWVSLVSSVALVVKKKAIVIGVIVLSVVGIALVPRRFGEGTNLLRTYSIASRYDTDVKYLTSLKYDVITGRGLNTFALSDTSEKGYPDHAKGPNNSYLYILATMGITGLCGWLLFYRDLYRKSRSKQTIIFVLIAALFNNVLFYPFIFLWIITTETIMAPSEV